MITTKYRTRAIVTACSLALASLSSFAQAQVVVAPDVTNAVPPPASPGVATPVPPAASPSVATPVPPAAAPGVVPPAPAVTTGADAEDARDAAEQVLEATRVIAQMERDGNLRAVLQQAQGIFIVPDYGRVAFGVGARGGEGVLMVKAGDTWSDPLFYDLGGVSGGLQIGAEGGDIAMILNNERAVNSFMQNNNWSLNADAGLTIIDWSAKGQASVGKGDVIVWSDTEGLFGDLAISVTDINFDEEETAAFYGGQVTLAEILTGTVESPPQVVAVLKKELPGATQSGGTVTAPSGAAAGAPAGNVVGGVR